MVPRGGIADVDWIVSVKLRSRTQRNLLPGMTAFLLRLRFALSTSTLFWLGLLALLNALQSSQSWTKTCVAFVMFVHVVAVCVLIARVSHKQRKERSAGYTTLRAEEKTLEQRDPYVGRRIRGPGEDYLSSASLREALRAARDESRRISGRAEGAEEKK